jgi:hypothetical protein
LSPIRSGLAQLRGAERRDADHGLLEPGQKVRQAADQGLEVGAHGEDHAVRAVGSGHHGHQVIDKGAPRVVVAAEREGLLKLIDDDDDRAGVLLGQALHQVPGVGARIVGLHL